MKMEVCNYKRTGQVFVHLDKQDKNKALMITPNGIVMALNYNMFTEPVEIEHEEALAKGIINRSQYNMYSHYREY